VTFDRYQIKGVYRPSAIFANNWTGIQTRVTASIARIFSRRSLRDYPLFVAGQKKRPRQHTSSLGISWWT